MEVQRVGKYSVPARRRNLKIYVAISQSLTLRQTAANVQRLNSEGMASMPQALSARGRKTALPFSYENLTSIDGATGT
jgi:hypothetical protein